MLKYRLFYFTRDSMQDDFNSAARSPEDMGRELVAEIAGVGITESCDIAKCLRLINNGARLDCLEETTGEPPLQAAVRLGYDDLTRALVEAGAPLEAKDDSGNTPLMTAAVYGRANLAETLIRSGAKLDETNSAGYTALIWAAYWGKADVAMLLIREGARTDITDNDGHTALDWTKLNESFSNPETRDAINVGTQDRAYFEEWRDQGMPLKAEMKVHRPLTLKLPTASFVG